MDFFWPEKYKRSEDLSVNEMLKLVIKKRDDLLGSLNRVSPQMAKSSIPLDLIKVLTIYDVFSVKGKEWDDVRVRFLERFKGRLLYFLENKNSLPDYRSFVRKLFNDLFDAKLKNEIKWMDLNSYFVKKGGKKLVSSTGLSGNEVETWDGFKAELIKLCRELFPYAEKRFNNLLYTKNFKNEILDLFFKKKKEEIFGILSETLIEAEKIVNESKKNQIANLNKEISESGGSKESYEMLELIENGDGKIFLEIDMMIKALSVFDVPEFDLRYDFIQFYINEVVEKFSNSSDKRDPLKKLKENSDSFKQKKKIEIGIEKNDTVKICENKSRISDENVAIIDEIVQISNLDRKKGKLLKRYLERLFVKGKDCRMSSLKRFGIIEIDDKLNNLFQNLGMLVENDVLDNQEDVFDEIGELDDNTVEIVDIDDKNSSDVFESSNENLSTKSEFDEKTLDFYSIILKQARKYNFKIFNEKKLKKQFEELCKTDDELKQILCVEMQKNSFGSPKKKQGRSYYTLEVAVTGIRFLLFKCKDGSFIIDGVYNHDDYEKRVKEVN